MSDVVVALLVPPAQFDHHDMDDGWWVLMAVGMVLFWALIVLGIIWIVRELRGHQRPAREGAEEPLAILDRRLADGTISVEEYRERRAILGGGPPRDSGGG